MTISCLVKDFDKAKRFLINELTGTKLGGYKRICEENDEYWYSTIPLNYQTII